MDDLITLNRAILDLHPSGHDGRVKSIDKFLLHLRKRRESFGMASDLAECVMLESIALGLHQPGDPGHATCHYMHRHLVDDLQCMLRKLENASDVLDSSDHTMFLHSLVTFVGGGLVKAMFLWTQMRLSLLHRLHRGSLPLVILNTSRPLPLSQHVFSTGSNSTVTLQIWMRPLFCTKVLGGVFEGELGKAGEELLAVWPAVAQQVQENHTPRTGKQWDGKWPPAVIMFIPTARLAATPVYHLLPRWAHMAGELVYQPQTACREK